MAEGRNTAPHRAIEESFPIVEINRLALPEKTGSGIKPIYSMHKWWARRASCVFRAILLGCMKPMGTDIMEEFYKDHTDDPDTNGKLIVDPFMGGGTTVVEALRLGCKVIGIDLNPVAWFIVKTEVEPVDLDALLDAFQRLEERKTESGKSVKDELLSHYRTECPCCGAGREKADIMYTFWVKSAICTNPTCGREVPLFSNYIIAMKNPSIRYWRDVTCPSCGKSFDWEIDSGALVAEPTLMVTSAVHSAGMGRTTARWAYSSDKMVRCPWCDDEVSPLPPASKPDRKRVALSVLLCPHCEAIWQWRGPLAKEVTCPVCQVKNSPSEGNIPSKGKFICPHCGTKDTIINSIRRLPEDELLPMHPYAIEGYCAVCGGDETEEDVQADLFGEERKLRHRKKQPDHPCRLTKNKGKFFKRITPSDLARHQAACERWERDKHNLPYPRQKIPEGFNTNQMIKHHYRYWHQMFNPRQLLCLSTLLKAIDEERDQTLQEMSLIPFFQSLRSNCMFAFYNMQAHQLEPALSRKDFAPPQTPLENNVWGTTFGRGTFSSTLPRVYKGKEYLKRPFDKRATVSQKGIRRLEKVYSGERVHASRDDCILYARSSTGISGSWVPEADFVVTDPPYAGNVNYSEVAEFFYVWLRLLLSKRYRYFAPDHTPKVEEIVLNPARKKSMTDFQHGLREVFLRVRKRLKEGGLLVLTFHHEANRAWEALLHALVDGGFVVQAVYPYESEARKGGAMGAQKIAYDLIHVCRKRPDRQEPEKRSWAGIRQEIRRRAREEIEAIEAGRYGKEPLAPEDVNIILIGKCLELHSRHYGAVVDYEGNEVTLHEALKEIRNMVDQLVHKERPLPAELEDIDAESRIYLLTLCDRKEIKSDEVHKATRGILEPDELIAAGLMIRGRAKRGRTYEVKQPSERLSDLLEKFGVEKPSLQPTLFGDAPPPKRRRHTLFIDHVHLLMGMAESGESLLPWLRRFKHETPRIRAASEYLAKRNKAFAPVLNKILRLLEPGPLFREVLP